jgi:integrase
VRGKGGRPRVVRIGHEAARALDRYLRIRARHEQAHRPQLWLGVNNRGPMTANGIYQMIARRARQAGVDAWTHRFRHHFSHTWLDRGGAEGDLMELNGWSSADSVRAGIASIYLGPRHRTFSSPHRTDQACSARCSTPASWYPAGPATVLRQCGQASCCLPSG